MTLKRYCTNTLLTGVLTLSFAGLAHAAPRAVVECNQIGITNPSEKVTIQLKGSGELEESVPAGTYAGNSGQVLNVNASDSTLWVDLGLRFFKDQGGEIRICTADLTLWKDRPELGVDMGIPLANTRFAGSDGNKKNYRKCPVVDSKKPFSLNVTGYYADEDYAEKNVQCRVVKVVIP